MDLVFEYRGIEFQWEGSSSNPSTYTQVHPHTHNIIFECVCVCVFYGGRAMVGKEGVCVCEYMCHALYWRKGERENVHICISHSMCCVRVIYVYKCNNMESIMSSIR